MKCPNCGAEILNPEAHFCPKCGSALIQNITESEPEIHPEPELTVHEAPEPEPVTEPEAPEEPVKKKAKPKSQGKTGKLFLDSLKHFFGLLVHPGKEPLNVPLAVSLITVLYLLVLNMISLFLLSSGFVKWIKGGFNGAPGKVFRIVPASMNVQANVFRVILGALGFTAGLLAVTVLLVMIGRLLKKNRTGFASALRLSIQQLVLPVCLMLVASIVVFIIPQYGIYLFLAVLILLFTNIVFIFKDRPGWIAYLAILTGISVILFMTAEILHLCIA